MNFDWNDLAFASKKPLNNLHAIFIAAPREISGERFRELVKQYLPKGNIVLGLAKEAFVDGFDGQPQFRMLQLPAVQKIIDTVNAKSPQHKIYTLAYFQRDTKYIFEQVDFAHIALVRGSWKYSFHTQAPYYVLARRGVAPEMVSPFTSEAEARAAEDIYMKQIAAAHPLRPGRLAEQEMMQLAGEAAAYSFDYSFQTGAALGKKTGPRYELLAWAYNKVVPFQTYAMLHGASREQNFSPPHDLNHYDTVHAEVALIISAQKQKLDLKGTTLFINLLPCPACARMFAETDIAEFVYREDHSGGYAVHMLQAAGKKIRRVV